MVVWLCMVNKPSTPNPSQPLRGVVSMDQDTCLGMITSQDLGYESRMLVILPASADYVEVQ